MYLMCISFLYEMYQKLNYFTKIIENIEIKILIQRLSAYQFNKIKRKDFKNVAK